MTSSQITDAGGVGRKTSIVALDFHLWCMTKAERAGVSVRGLRKKVRYVADLSDQEVQAAIARANAFRFVDPVTRAVSP